MLMRVIVIWGLLIAAYLILTKSSGFSQSLSALGSFVTGSTKALQGR